MRLASCLLVLTALVAAGDSARGAADAIRVPPGFAVDVYARGLQRPTALAWGAGGALYATQEGGSVVRVKPRATIARGFDSPLGLAWSDGRLFVSARGTLWRVERGRRWAVVSKLPFGRHQQDNVVVHRGRVYFGSGSTCDACAEKSRLSAAVLSVRPDGRDLRVVARGLRNPFGLAVDPATGRLYASINERDELGDDEPAETVVEVRQGRRFGWPACWPSYRRKRLLGECRGVSRPLAYLQPHSSADGLVVYRRGSFGRRFKGNLFVAEWGQYLEHDRGRKVSRVVLRPGRPAAVSTFASGFDHPIAVAIDPRGALLVADYGRGLVYRIRARRTS
ncbi:MAG: PQQ-dependent sugar dehydrogenase [Gaiellaceae bacterium]